VIRAVLDANVYVSAAVRPEGLPGQILEGFLGGEAFEIVMSKAIVEEVLRALNYPKLRKYIRQGLDPELWHPDCEPSGVLGNPRGLTRRSRRVIVAGSVRHARKRDEFEARHGPRRSRDAATASHADSPRSIPFGSTRFVNWPRKTTTPARAWMMGERPIASPVSRFRPD
jgi:hypothetical protein